MGMGCRVCECVSVECVCVCVCACMRACMRVCVWSQPLFPGVFPRGLELRLVWSENVVWSVGVGVWK